MNSATTKEGGVVSCRVIHRSEAAYAAELQLRYEVLRKPLGMPVGSEVNEAEAQCIHVVAECDQAVIGCVILRPDDDGSGQLMQMAVASTHHGRGIGRALVRALEAHCREQGMDRIYMHARVSARVFYEKLGYVAAGDEFTEVGIPHLHMERRIS